MRTDTTPAALPGTIVLTEIRGPLGLLVGLGQLLTRDGSRYTHAGICVGDGTVIEAHPRGVRVVQMSEYLDGRAIAFGWMIPLSAGRRARIVEEAQALIGARYNWLDYVSLGLTHFGIRPGFVARRIARSDRLICSQLCDTAYLRAGIHLFDDGRAPGDVTPGDLANLFIEQNWALHQGWTST